MINEPFRPRPGWRWARRGGAALCAGVLAVLAASGPAHADSVREAQWQLGFLHLAEAHKISQGDQVTVAVIDTGVDAGHPDLVGSVLPGYDATAGDHASSGESDLDGHGTAMAGLIAAHGRALGIAPLALLLPVRTSLFSPAGGDSSASIDWAVDHGAQVLCLAFGQQDTPDLRAAVARAVAHDVVVVAGVGNEPQIPGFTYPAGYPGVIGAAGVDRQGKHATVSVVGAQAMLAAPAVDIVSTGLRGPGRTGYVKGDGTSNATAIIAGVAALVRSTYPDLPAAEVVRRLTLTADDKGPAGRDTEYGFGVVNPVRALTAVVPAMSVGTSAESSPTRAPTSGTNSPPASSSRTLTIRTIVFVGVILAIGVLLVVRQARRRRSADDR